MMNNAVIAKPVIENPDPAAAVVTAGVAVVACVVTFDTSGVSVTSISPVVRSTTRSVGVVTSTTILETSVSVVRELVIMLSSAAVVSGKGSTTAVVSNGDIDELVVVVVDVLVLFSVLLVVVVLIAIVLLFVVVLLVVVLLVVVLVLVVVDVMLVVVVLVEVITGDEVVDLFGTGINTATELSSIIVGFSSVLSLSELFSRALIAFSIAFVNASWSNTSGFGFGCSTGSVGLVGFIGCGVVKNGSPVKSSVISGKSKLAVVLKSQSGAVGVSSNGVVKKSMIIGGGVVSNGTNSVVSGIGGRPVTGAVSPSVTKSGRVVKSNIDPVVNLLGASVGNVITVDKSISGAPVVKAPKSISSVVKAPKGPSVVSR